MITPGLFAQEQITLVHFAYPGSDAVRAFTDARIAEFEALHPNVKIEKVMPARVATIMDEFITQVAAGRAPDTTETILRDGGTLMAAGHFLDLRPFFEKDPDISLDQFAGPAINAMTWPDGRIWGIPRDMFAPTTFYNADMFAEAGLATPTELGEEGWTWDAFVNAARRLTVDRDGDGVNDQWGFENSYGVLFSYANPVYQAGGAYYDRQTLPTRATLLNPNTVFAIEWILSLYKEYNVVGGENDFAAGKAGISFSKSASWISRLQDAGINFGVATNTMGPVHNGGYYAVNSVNITQYSRHPEIAWEWAKFLAANEENQRKLVRETQAVTSHLGALRDYHELSSHSPELVAPIIATVTNPNSFHEAIGAGVGDLILDTLWADSVVGNAPARITLEKLQPQVQAILDARR